MGNLMQQQLPPGIQTQHYNAVTTQPISQMQNNIQEQVQNEAILTLNPTQQQENDKNTEKEKKKEPEFTKYVKQLKVLH